MVWSEKKLMRLLDLIDLPRHDEAVNMVRQWRIFTIVITALSGAGIWFILFSLTMTKSVSIAVAIPVIFLAILVERIFLGDDFKTPDNETVGGITALLGLVLGIIIGFGNNLDLVMIAVYSFVGAVIGMIAGAILSWAGGVLLLCLNLLALSGFPIYWLILYIPRIILEKKIKSVFPGWKNEDGSPIVKLSSDGLGGINYHQRSIFVAAKNLRRNGKSQDFGIPKFTFLELNNTGQVNLKMNVAAAAFASGAIVADVALEHQWVNPTTGLPLIDNIPGGIDVGGNYWGEVTNSEIGLEHVSYDTHES